MTLALPSRQLWLPSARRRPFFCPRCGKPRRSRRWWEKWDAVYSTLIRVGGSLVRTSGTLIEDGSGCCCGGGPGNCPFDTSRTTLNVSFGGVTLFPGCSDCQAAPPPCLNDDAQYQIGGVVNLGAAGPLVRRDQPSYFAGVFDGSCSGTPDNLVWGWDSGTIQIPWNALNPGAGCNVGTTAGSWSVILCGCGTISAAWAPYGVLGSNSVTPNGQIFNGDISPGGPPIATNTLPALSPCCTIWGTGGTATIS